MEMSMVTMSLNLLLFLIIKQRYAVMRPVSVNGQQIRHFFFFFFSFLLFFFLKMIAKVETVYKAAQT